MDKSYDYVIVGAGAAGCVLANRLSADPKNSVLLLEAGPADDHYLIHMPKGMGKLVFDPNHCWYYPVDQPRIPGEQPGEVWVAGKVLGGSSSINGMIYVRGQAEDYDEWERLGATGWNSRSMLEAFKSIEDHELDDSKNHGRGGPVHVTARGFRYPLTEKLIKAGCQMGLKRSEDLTSSELESVGYYHYNIKNGKRQSSAVAFLNPARSRKNLDIISGVQIDRVLFSDHKATAVTGIKDGQPVRYNVRREVILSAGAVQSPRILQLSGIGPASVLKAAGVEVVVESPDVGRRMRDHLSLTLSYRLNNDRGVNWRFNGLGLVLSAAQYYLWRGGPLATGPYEIGAFVRSKPEISRPDVQLYLGAFSFKPAGPGSVALEPDSQPGLSVCGSILRGTSEGELEIKSSDPREAVSIKPNWLSTDYDCETAISIIKYIRQYLTMPEIAPYVGEEIGASAHCRSDEEILDYFRKVSNGGTHLVASCRMGTDDKAVVDPRGRVNGVDGLRVVDCSIMPAIVSGNTNAPAMALGWRASSLILEDN